MPTARQHPEVIDEFLQKELASLAHSHYFTLMVNVDGFGVVPKKHQPGKWHLITDLSFPEEESVNTPLIHPCAHLNTQIAKRVMSFGRGQNRHKGSLLTYNCIAS